MKEQALDRRVFKIRFGRDYGPVVKQATEWILQLQLSNTLIQYTNFNMFRLTDSRHQEGYIQGTMCTVDYTL